MARTTLTPVKLTNAGALMTGNYETGTADGHQVSLMDDNLVIVIENTDAGGAHTVTFPTPPTLTAGALTVEDQSYSIAASSIAIFGGFEKEYFSNSGRLYLDFEVGEHDHFEVYAAYLPK